MLQRSEDNTKVKSRRFWFYSNLVSKSIKELVIKSDLLAVTDFEYAKIKKENFCLLKIT